MEAIHELYDALCSCEYVLVGAGAGLSAAAGISFANEEVFRRDYPALWAQGVHSDYQTFSYKGWLPGQRWGYLARHIKEVLLDTPALPLYSDLKDLLEGLNYFVITSNVDHQFIKANFPEERVFEAQGHYGLMVCSAGCAGDEWNIAPLIERTLPHIADDLTVAEEWLPRCPRCGALLRPAFRDTCAHAEGDRRYHDFLAASEDASIAIVEFGVGFNSAGVIRVPFERITGERDKARFFRVTVDYVDSDIEIAYPEIPKPIADKSRSINRDAAEVIRELLAMKRQ